MIINIKPTNYTMAAEKRPIKVIATNKKAKFEYFFLDKYKAGVMLTGTEVKSVKLGRVSMSDAYCYFRMGELWLRNLHIAEYKQGGYNNHEPKRDRKLLLQKRELKKLEIKIKERGLTIIPVEVFISENGFVKVEIALSKGKKAYNKKQSIKEKDLKRDMDRSMRQY